MPPVPENGTITALVGGVLTERSNRMKILKKTFAIRKAFDYISAPRQTELVCRDTVKCPSGLRSTPGKCVYKKLYREFESLLHRQIMKTQTPDFPRESRGFVVFGVPKTAPWDRHGTGALFWCEKSGCQRTGSVAAKRKLLEVVDRCPIVTLQCTEQGGEA